MSASKLADYHLPDVHSFCKVVNEYYLVKCTTLYCDINMKPWEQEKIRV